MHVPNPINFIFITWIKDIKSHVPKHLKDRFIFQKMYNVKSEVEKCLWVCQFAMWWKLLGGFLRIIRNARKSWIHHQEVTQSILTSEIRLPFYFIFSSEHAHFCSQKLPAKKQEPQDLNWNLLFLFYSCRAYILLLHKTK